MKFSYKLGIIGAGNMAKAIVSGILAKKVLTENDILVADPFTDINIDGIECVKSNEKIYKDCEFIILAVKPQIFNSVIKQELGKCILSANYIISIMAGVASSAIKEAVGENINIIKVMPNTPCKLGLGISAIAMGEIDANAKIFVDNIFNSIGEVVYLEEEKFHAVTCVSGSGPAYIYMFIKGMIDAGVKAGLDFQTSKKMVLATFNGATAMVGASQEDIDLLIDAVCSKGGTTIEAVNTFKDGQLYQLIENAMQNCYNRSVELSK